LERKAGRFDPGRQRGP